MNLYVYAYLNNVGGFYGQPFTTNFEPEEYKELYVQSLFTADDKVLSGLKDNDLYLIATFDNVSGDVIPTKGFILHCSEVVNLILSKKNMKDEDNKDVQS